MGKSIEFDEEGLPIPQKVKVPTPSVKFDDEGLPVPIKKKEQSVPSNFGSLAGKYGYTSEEGSISDALKTVKSSPETQSDINREQNYKAVTSPKLQVTQEEFDEDPVAVSRKVILSKMPSVKRYDQPKTSEQEERVGELSFKDGDKEIQTVKNFYSENTNGSIAHLSKITGINNPDLLYSDEFDEQIKQSIKPGNETDRLAYERLQDAKKARAVVRQNLEEGKSFEDMAIDYAAANSPEMAKVIQQLQSTPTAGEVMSGITSVDRKPEEAFDEATIGRFLYDFYNSSAIRQEMEKIPGMTSKVVSGANQLIQKYPSFGKMYLGSLISQKMEDMGMNNAILNVATKAERDKAVDALVAEGKMSPLEVQFYKDNIRSISGLGLLRRKITGNPIIDTPGALESTVGGAYGGFKNTVGGLYELTGLRESVLGNQGALREDLEKTNKQVSIKPKGTVNDIAMNAGQFFGQSMSIGLGGKMINTVKLAKDPMTVIGLVGATQAYANYLPQARMMFPGNELKQKAYAMILSGIEWKTEKIFNDKKVVDGLLGKLKPNVVETIKDFTSKKISAEAARANIQSSISRAIKDIPDAAKYFGKAVVQNDIEELSAELGGQLTRGIFQNKPFDEWIDGEDLWETTKAATLGSPIIGTLAARADMQKNRGITAKTIYSMAKDPEYWKGQIMEGAKLDETLAAEAPDKIKNLETAAKIVQELDETDLTEKQKVKFVITELEKQIKADAAKNAAVPAISKAAISELEKVQQDILDGKDDGSIEGDKSDDVNPDEKKLFDMVVSKAKEGYKETLKAAETPIEGLEYLEDKYAENPVKFREDFGDDIADKIGERTSTEKLESAIDYLIQQNPDDPAIPVLDKLISERTNPPIDQQRELDMGDEIIEYKGERYVKKEGTLQKENGELVPLDMYEEIKKENEAKKADIERRRNESLNKKTSFKNTNHKQTNRYSINIASKFGFDGFDVDVSSRNNNSTTGFIYNKALSQHFDTIEEAKLYASEIASRDKEYIAEINAKYDAELKALENKPTPSLPSNVSSEEEGSGVGGDENAWGSDKGLTENFYTTDVDGYAIKKTITNPSSVTIDGVDFHIAKVDGDWKVIEKKSGLEISTGKISNTKNAAIEDATIRLAQNGGAKNLPTLIDRAIQGFKDRNTKAVEQSLKEQPASSQPLTEVEGGVGVGGDRSDGDIEKRMAELEGAKIGTPELAEFNALEKEMEKRERDTVFNVPLENVNDAVDALMKKEKEQPNGFGSFIEKRDARETKEVADRYLNAKELTDAELKQDFSDAVRGNPTTWYADGLKMREALKEATNRGIDTKDMLAEVVKVYEDAGYDIETAKSVVAGMLKPIFEGSQKVNEKKAVEQSLKEQTKVETVKQEIKKENEAKKADIERRRQEELNKETPVKKEDVEIVKTKETSNEEPVLPEGEIIVTYSGMTEPERQRRVAERQGKSGLTEEQSLENELADLAYKAAQLTYSSKAQAESNLRQRVRAENAKAGYEKYKYDSNHVKKRVVKRKGALKGREVWRKVSSVNKDVGNQSIKEGGVILRDRGTDLQNNFENLVEVAPYLEVEDANGRKMSKDQIDLALQDIFDGIPSVQAENLLNVMEEALAKDDFPVRDNFAGERIRLNDLLGVKSEIIGEPLTEDAIKAWLNDESELTPEQEEIINSELQNILYEYENEREIELPISESKQGTKEAGSAKVEPEITASETKKQVNESTQEATKATEPKPTIKEPSAKEKSTEDSGGAKEPPKTPTEGKGVGEEGGEIRERRFSKQVISDENILPQVKKGVESAMEYVEQTNAMSIAEAAEIIDRVGVDEAYNLVVSDNNVKGAVRVVLGQVLIKKYNQLAKEFQDKGDTEKSNYYINKSIDVANYASERFGTEAGQMIQAFSLFSSLTPEAQVRAAAKDVKKQYEKKSKKRKPDIDDLGEKMQKANEEATDELLKSKKVTESAAKAQKSSVQKAKEKVKKAQDKRKKLLDKYKGNKGGGLTLSSGGLTKEGLEYVGELVKTYIDEGIANIQVISANVVQHLKDVGAKVNDAVERNISDIISEQVEKSNNLKIVKGLADLEKEIGKIIRSHYTVPVVQGESLKQKFINEIGLDGKDAEDLAAEIQKEFDAIATRKKQDILFKERAKIDKIQHDLERGKPKSRKEVQDDIVKYSNLGAFGKEDFFEFLSKKLNLGKLTVDEAREIERLAQKIEKAPEGSPKNDATQDLLKYRANMKGVSGMEMAQAVWYANILSGHKTHIVNVVSTFFNGAAFFASEAIRSPRSIPVLMYGAARGLRRGGFEAWHTLKTGRSPIHISKIETPSTLERIRFIGGWFNPGNYLKFVGRLMQAEDVLQFQALKEMRATQLAYKEARALGEKNPFGRKTWKIVEQKLLNTKERSDDAKAQAQMEGLKPNSVEWKRRVYELMEMNRDIQMTEEAYGFAAEGTFNHAPEGTLGAITNGVSSLLDMTIGGTRPLRFFVPFTKIITNVVNNALNFTPVGFIRAARGQRGFESFDRGIFKGAYKELTPEQKKQLIAKASLGVAMTGGIYALTKIPCKDGHNILEITGGGTGDFGKDAQLKESGWQPYSIRVCGGSYISYKYTPLVFNLAYLGYMNDNEKYGKDSEATMWRKISGSAYQTAQLALDGTWVGSTSDLMGTIASSTPSQLAGNVEKTIGKMAAQTLVPNWYLQGAQQTEEWLFLNQKDARGQFNRIKQHIPVVRNSMNDKLNALGEPIKTDVDIFISENKPHKVWDYLNERNVFVSTINPNTFIIYDADTNEERVATQDEFYAFSKLRGEKIREGVEKLIGSEDVAVMDGDKIVRKKGVDLNASEVKEKMKGIVSSATVEAKDELFKPMPTNYQKKIQESLLKTYEDIEKLKK